MQSRDQTDSPPANLPDWLPAGWTVESRVQKTGREIRYYKNLETGTTLYTKEDVIQYVRVEGDARRKSARRTGFSHLQNKDINLMEESIQIIESPEWLPDGWITEIRIPGNGVGRKYKHYIHLLTGTKCFSKPEVFRYLESEQGTNVDSVIGTPTATVNEESYKNLETGTTLYTKEDGIQYVPVEVGARRKSAWRTGFNPLQNKDITLVEESIQITENPEWLPDGWIAEVRIRGSGATMGRRDMHYIHLLSGTKCFSKPEVFRFLKSEQGTNVDSVIGTPTATVNEELTVESNERPDWLPDNWIIELKTLKIGKNNERNIKSYKNLETGTTLYTKDDVMQYVRLEGGARRKRSRRTGFSPLQNKDITLVEESIHITESPEWLPDGWIAELRIRGSGVSMGRRDTHYIHLLTGTKCFSKPEVFRFLKSEQGTNVDSVIGTPTGTVSEELTVESNERPEWLPDNWTIESKTLKTGKHNERSIKIYKDLLTGCCCYCKPDVLRVIQSRQQKQSINVYSSHSTEKPAVETSEHPKWLPENWTVEEYIRKSGKTKGRKIKKYRDLLTGYCCQSKPEVLRCLESKRHDNVQSASETSSGAKRQKQEHPTSERPLLADDDSNAQNSIPVAMVEPPKYLQDKGVHSEDGHAEIDESVLTPAADILQRKNSHQRTKADTTMTASSNGKHLPRTSSKRVSKLALEQPADTVLGDKRSRPNEPNGNPHITDKSPSFHSWSRDSQSVTVEKPPALANGITNNNQAEPELISQFKDYLTDPCLEFAFKTLTGTSATEDDSVILDYFQQQFTDRDSKITPIDMELPSFSGIDTSLNLDEFDVQPIDRRS